MTGDLDHIFPGVGMGGAKNGCYDFVEDVFSIENVPKCAVCEATSRKSERPENTPETICTASGPLSRTKAIAPTPAGWRERLSYR